MRLLLDTHVLVWALGDLSRLSQTAAAQIREPANELFVAAITPFELATKHRIGKLPNAESRLLAFGDHMRRLGASELPISGHHALVAGQLNCDHRDPFDRMLAAQSITEAIPLVTSDAAFGSISGVRVIW
jgi:PIN domain nuclease of toxin-antitoxin system